MNIPSNNVRDYPNLTRAVNDMVGEINNRSPYKESGSQKLVVPDYYYIEDGAFVVQFKYRGQVGSMSIEFGSRGRNTGLPNRKDPPVNSILRWVEKKGIRGKQRRSRITGRFQRGFYTAKQVAYAIARLIGRRGTAAKGWGRELVAKVVDEYQVRFSQAVAKDFDYQFAKYFPDLAK